MTLVVVNSRWMAPSRHQLSPDGAFAENRATRGQPTPSNDTARRIATKNRKKRSRAPRNANQRQLAPSSLLQRRNAFVWFRAKDFVRSSNFLGGKTNNKEWPVRVAQANLRIHRAPCRSTRASRATDSTPELRTSGSPRPSSTR
jgi:hypothetical protein